MSAASSAAPIYRYEYAGNTFTDFRHPPESCGTLVCGGGGTPYTDSDSVRFWFDLAEPFEPNQVWNTPGSIPDFSDEVLDASFQDGVSDLDLPSLPTTMRHLTRPELL